MYLAFYMSWLIIYPCTLASVPFALQKNHLETVFRAVAVVETLNRDCHLYTPTTFSVDCTRMCVCVCQNIIVGPNSVL